MPDSRFVLLADDDPLLLRLTRTYIERMGYKVQSAADGKAAMTAFDADPSAFDLLVVDLTLNGMSGENLAKHVCAESPRIRVLLYSGYPFDVAALPADIRQRCGSLQKPFTPVMLKESIGQLLDN